MDVKVTKVVQQGRKKYYVLEESQEVHPTEDGKVWSHWFESVADCATLSEGMYYRAGELTLYGGDVSIIALNPDSQFYIAVHSEATKAPDDDAPDPNIKYMLLYDDCVRAEDKAKFVESVALRQPQYLVDWYYKAVEEANKKFGKGDPMAYRARHPKVE